MGLAASQARYLALTARRSDLEYQSQTINSRRIQLSYKTAEIAREYSDGMNNSRIKIAKMTTGEDGKARNTWEELTFKNLLAGGYMLIGAEGTALDPNPYLSSPCDDEKYEYANPRDFADTEHPVALTGQDKDEKAMSFNVTQTITAAQYNSLTGSTLADLKAFYAEGEKDADGNVKNYTLITSLTNLKNKEQWTTISNVLKNRDNKTSPWYNLASKFKFGTIANYDYKVNPKYSDGKGADIQSLLVSGNAQIVTKAFYDFLVGNGYYSPTLGFIPEGKLGKQTFYTLMEKFENSEEYNFAGRKSVIDWRSDETDTFESRTYTEDDEKVLAKYEADTAKIQALDKQLEMEEKNIETQHKAVETELENLKKVIQKNIEDTFKIFS